LTMKIKIDEDLPKTVGELISAYFQDTTSVLEEGLSGTLDPALWKVVQMEGRFLITGDKGFANIRKYPPGTHYGVLLLRPEFAGIPQMKQLTQEVLRSGVLDKMAGCISVATPGRIRIRRPAIKE
jgi:predicted nuclease of predicted toxin-antitoxin system